MRRLVLILAGLGLPASAFAAAGQQPIEPIDVPPSIEQGLDMVYIDREMAPSIEQRDEQLQAQGYDDFKVAPVDMFAPVHPLYTDLRRALIRYQMRWGSLPQVQVASGPTLKLNSTGDRVAVLRQRLGLPEGTKFDAATAAAVKEFQGVHGFKADGIAGAGTIKALNLGYKHYENVLLLNMERARRLPSPANSMGMMKFMLPNYFGIYLHDSPEKEHFTKNELWISNGCVRVEDYKRFASWLFDGSVPRGKDPKVEEEMNLPAPVPVYMTYLTVQPTASGVRFLDDHYGRDANLMKRFGARMVAAAQR
jgi:murein L,D-transpeptidase YcbB/YkuD